MYTVIMPIDENEERALAIADAVKDLPDSDTAIEAVVFHVIEDFRVADDSGGIIDSDDLKDDIEPPESVEMALRALESANVSTSVRDGHGDPATEILDTAATVDADLIALSGRKRSPAGKAVFGSVTQSVILSADRPVMVVTE